MSNSELLSKIDHDSQLAAAKARETAGSIGKMAEAAVSTVGSMATHAAENLREDADYLTARAGRGVQRLGEQMSRAAPHEGMLGDVSQSVARTITDGGEYIKDSKLSGMEKT